MPVQKNEMAFRLPRDGVPPGLLVKVPVPPGFGGPEKFRRVDMIARLIYEVAYGWASITDLLAVKKDDAKLYVDDCCLVAVMVAHGAAKSVAELRRIESVGRMLVHLANPKVNIPLTDLERYVLGIGCLPTENNVDQLLASQKPYRRTASF